jgi:hypothetical protein
VAGWSSTDGGFIWPGGLLFLVIIIFLFWIIRRK